MAIYWTFMFLIGLVFCQGQEPEISTSVGTKTVEEGETLDILCTVKFKGNYTVTWIHAESGVLTEEDRRITDDPRISVERTSTDEWTLYIGSVVLKDSGQYTCQINTNPVKRVSVNIRVTMD